MIHIINQINKTIGLMNSMINSGESHSESSLEQLEKCRSVITELEKIQSSRRIIQRQTCEDLLESMEGCYPEYHIQVVKDYMSDDV